MSSEQYKILIVDDEPDIRDLLQYCLKREGYNTSTAANGEESIVEALKFIPDLIIMDMMMPKMDGIEACRILKSLDDLRNTILVFMTARSEEFFLNAAFTAGADDYICKPKKPQEIISHINSILKFKTLPLNLNFRAR